MILQWTLFDFVPCSFHYSTSVIFKFFGKRAQEIQKVDILYVDYICNLLFGSTLALLHIWLSNEYDLLTTISLPSDGGSRYYCIPKLYLIEALGLERVDGSHSGCHGYQWHHTRPAMFTVTTERCWDIWKVVAEGKER